MSFTVHAFGDTNKGLFREINEDNLMVGRTIFAVADGMGGHAAGEVASAAAIGPLQAIDGTTFRDPAAATEALASAVREANALVIDKATADPDLRGMGTTLTTVMVRGRRLHLAHVGDSRAYLLRGGVLEMLTEDHTLVNELVKEGRLTKDQAAHHPQRSVITRAIGVESAIEVDVMPTPLELMPGDQILLCSDGLTGPVSEALIAEILQTEADGNIACQRLIDAANAGGGPDNITCVLLRVEGEGAAPAPVEDPRPATSDDDATAELGEPSTLDARRLAELSDGDPEIGAVRDDHARDGGGRTRRIGAIAVGVLVVLAILIGGAYLLINRQYYVGVDDAGQVGIYRGIQGDVLGLPLSTLVEEQPFGLDEVPERLHQGLEAGISFSTEAEAAAHIRQVLLPAVEEVDDVPTDDASEAAPAESATEDEDPSTPDLGASDDAGP